MNDRNIADARRHARRMARETGQPYQAMLDSVAVEAGRPSWTAFVRDPCRMPPWIEAAKTKDERARHKRLLAAISAVVAVGFVMTAIALLMWASHDVERRDLLGALSLTAALISLYGAPAISPGRIMGFAIPGRASRPTFFDGAVAVVQIVFAIVMSGYVAAALL